MAIQFPKSSILDRVLGVFIISATNRMIHFDSLPAGGFWLFPAAGQTPVSRLKKYDLLDKTRANEMSRVRVARLQLQGILISQVPCRAELFIRYYWSCIAVLLKCAFVRGISTVPGCRTRVAGTVQFELGTLRA